jgi:NADH-quinone oxidoreductase subunit G
MSVISVDGRDYEVQRGDNLLHALLSVGLDVPYFCWHPALGSVGACRQCAVKEFRDEHDAHGRLVMACMTAATDHLRVSVRDADAIAFRASVIEWLMINHPHDCPVCEEGGECHLQDMTVMTGHVKRRYRFTKRTHRNQYLGPFVAHEMNRCIACYRCVRFYRDYAGGRDFDVQAAHDHVYFGRHADGVLESDFSGNLAEVCPTGVFTDKTLSAEYTRKWDMEGAPSVCVHCGVGCNTLVNARYGQVRRTLNRYNSDVNGYFLCDRGRFGYGFVNGAARIRQPLLAGGDGSARPIPQEAALQRLCSILLAGKVIGIGSPRASLESNFALRRLVGGDRFYAGIAEAELQLLRQQLAVFRRGELEPATLRQAEESDAVFILGEDAADTAPRLALALRQAVRQAELASARRQKIPDWQDAAVRNGGHGIRSPLIIATPDVTKLDDIAAETVRAAPQDIARLGFAVAHAIDGDAPDVDALSAVAREVAQRTATALRKAERPLIVCGTGSGAEAVLHAAVNIALALRRADRSACVFLTAPECNSVGLAALGGESLSAALTALREHRARAAIVLENDLFRRAPGKEVESALAAAEEVVVLDHTLTETAHHAHLVLPAATYAESSGTLVSNEGRAQRYFQVLFPAASASTTETVFPAWHWLARAARECGREGLEWSCVEQLTEALAADNAAFADIVRAAPRAGYRIAGSRVSSAPHRYSGRTAMFAGTTVHEPPPPRSPADPFTHSMEGYYGPLPAALYPFYWAPQWNSVQALNKFQQEVGGPMCGGDAGVRLLAAKGADEDRRPCQEYYEDIPAPFSGRAGMWLLVAHHRVFGSEELSALSPSVAERITCPAVAVNAADAAAIGVAAGTLLEVALEGNRLVLPLEVRPALPSGVAALSITSPRLAALELPAWGTLRRAAAPGSAT